MDNTEYKKRLQEDLIFCERALLNYPNKEKKIKHLINFLNKRLEGLN
jgi:hypothetical protein